MTTNEFISLSLHSHSIALGSWSVFWFIANFPDRFHCRWNRSSRPLQELYRASSIIFKSETVSRGDLIHTKLLNCKFQWKLCGRCLWPPQHWFMANIPPLPQTDQNMKINLNLTIPVVNWRRSQLAIPNIDWFEDDMHPIYASINHWTTWNGRIRWRRSLHL